MKAHEIHRPRVAAGESTCYMYMDMHMSRYMHMYYMFDVVGTHAECLLSDLSAVRFLTLVRRPVCS